MESLFSSSETIIDKMRQTKSGAQEHFKAADTMHRQGRLDDAERGYRAALQIDGDCIGAMAGLGALYFAEPAPGATKKRSAGFARRRSAMPSRRGGNHEVIAPACYLEIGVQAGRSLALAKRRAIGVDPAPKLERPLAAGAELHTATSDDFFEFLAAKTLGQPLDMAFIDGMHLFEFVLRDFMAIESRSSPYGLVVVDDIFPNHPLQAERVRRTRTWMGDVWRLAQALREYRPDLVLLPLDTEPSGLLLVAGLNPKSTVLRDAYNPLVGRFAEPATPTASVLARVGALDPRDPLVRSFLERLRDGRLRGETATQLRAALTSISIGVGVTTPDPAGSPPLSQRSAPLCQRLDWRIANVRKPNYWGRSVDFLWLNPNRWAKPAAEAGIEAPGLAKGGRFVARIKLPFEKSAPILFEVDISSDDGRPLGRGEAMLSGGLQQELSFPVGASAQPVRVTIRTRLSAEARNADYAWAALCRPSLVESDAGPDFASIRQFHPAQF